MCCHFLFCLDELTHGISLPTRCREVENLAERHSELAYREDGFHARFTQQDPTPRVKDKLKETSQKCGETAIPPETGELVVSYCPLRKTSVEIFCKGRQGDRQKRITLIFDSTRDSFNITSGVNAAHHAQIHEHDACEALQAFHDATPFLVVVNPVLTRPNPSDALRSHLEKNP